MTALATKTYEDAETMAFKPFPIRKVAPSYPREAQRHQLEGKVVVKVTLDQCGQITDATIEESSGHLSLNNAALAAARQWDFVPGIRHGKTLTAITYIPFHFALN